MQTTRYKVFGVHPEKGNILLFTWVGVPEVGIALAKKQAPDFGYTKLTGFYAEKIEDQK